MDLSKIEQDFLKRYGITEDQVFDATGMSAGLYKRRMKGANFKVAKDVTPCKEYGHRLRTRHGHCAVCNPKNLNIIKRHHLKAYVYIAYSNMLDKVKVGFCTSISERQKQLRTDKYANANDWKILGYVLVENAGKVESDAQRRLHTFRAKGIYEKNSESIDANEVFHCSIEVAINALQKASGAIYKSISLHEILIKRVKPVIQNNISTTTGIYRETRKASINKLTSELEDLDKLRDAYFKKGYEELMLKWNNEREDLEINEQKILKAAIKHQNEIKAQLQAHKPMSAEESRNYLTKLPGTNSLPPGHKDATPLPKGETPEETLRMLGIELTPEDKEKNLVVPPFDQVKVPEELKKQLGKPRPSPPMKFPEFAPSADTTRKNKAYPTPPIKVPKLNPAKN